MVFEVDSIKVARGIEFVVRNEAFFGSNLVVLLPKGKHPFPKICHGGEWMDVKRFTWLDLTVETVRRYMELNAIVVAFKSNHVVIIDISGFMILELNCSYNDALSYLEYLLY